MYYILIIFKYFWLKMSYSINSIAIKFTEDSSDNKTPKYLRLADTLSKSIESGELELGDRIPPEDALTSLFDVSLGTIQRAFRILSERGLVERKKRKGTFVSGREAPDAFVYRFKDSETGKIQMTYTRVLSVSEVPWASNWGRYLQTDRCVRVERLLWVANDDPAYTEFYVPFEISKFLLDEPLENLHGASLHRLLADERSYSKMRFDHGLSCQQLTENAHNHLDVPEGTFGSIWNVVGYLSEKPNTYHKLQLPAGHKPIKWEFWH